MTPLNIAIIGATGLVGRTFLSVIDEYKIPVSTLRVFASEASIGRPITFLDTTVYCETLEGADLSGIDVALFSAGAHVSKQYAKKFTALGIVVIDNSSAYRMDIDVPLVVPEVNLNDVKNATLIANPNCSTIQTVLPLNALKSFGLVAVDYHTYQAVSGAGLKGIHDLYDHEVSHFTYDIKETVIPHIDAFLEDGFTKEEEKMMQETKKILHLPDLKVSATCVRVPIEIGHAVSMSITFKEDIALTDIKQALKMQPGLTLIDDPQMLQYPTTLHAKGNDDVYVGRLRIDRDQKNKLLMFVTADNVRKGAASNAVQILKELFYE